MPRVPGTRVMRERATVWIALAGKQRPAVVIEVRDDFVRVAYGTSQAPAADVRAEAVHVQTRAGRKFPLSALTWFVGANTAWEPPSGLAPGAGDCARDLFTAIQLLVEEHDAQVASDSP